MRRAVSRVPSRAVASQFVSTGAGPIRLTFTFESLSQWPVDVVEGGMFEANTIWCHVRWTLEEHVTLELGLTGCGSGPG